MNAPQGFLPYGRHCIEDDDIEAVVQALRGEFLTSGPLVQAFERALCAVTGAQHVVACSNGTAALHLAARALNLGPGTVSIVPAITFLATANAVRLTGGDVVFADVDPDSGLMRPCDLEAALARCPDRRADAVFNVHLAGQFGDLEGIAAVARRHNLRIVEDACHALGTKAYDQDGEAFYAGSNRYADLTCFSFHPVKTIAMGEGGAITTNDPDLAAIMRRDRTHGMTRDASQFELPEEALASDGSVQPWYYEMDVPGLNYRVPDILCALGLSQLKKLPRFSKRRQELCKIYDRRLAQAVSAIEPLSHTDQVEAAWHLYVTLIDFESVGLSRTHLMRQLADQGIGTQVHYFPVYRQPYYRRLETGVEPLRLPGADSYYRRALSLPLFPGMSDDDVHRVADVLLSQIPAFEATTCVAQNA